MSSSLGRLRGIFVTTPKPTTIATTTSTIPKILPPTSTATTTTTTTTTTTPNSKTAVMVTNIVKQFKKNSRSDSFRRNSYKYEATVRRLIAGKHFSAIETILEHQRKYKESMSEETFAVRLISLYGKAKMFKNARKLFDDMPSLGVNRTVISFNALLYAYVNSKKYDEIAEIFKEMPAISSIEPDIVSYNTMIKAFCEMGALDSAVTIMDKMEKDGITPDLISYNTILDKYYKSDKFSEAEKLWSVMKDKNIVPNARTYNPKLRGLVQNGRVLEAVELIKEMEENEVKPDVFSYNSVIKGFVDEGNLEEVKKWYEKIEENGLIPDYVTFGMLIPFFREKGDFSYVFGLCKRIIELKMHILYAEIQKVVDGLIENSRVEEAKELFELANTSKIYRNKLKMKIIE